MSWLSEWIKKLFYSSNKTATEPHNISSAALVNKLREAGFPPHVYIFRPDRSYALPKKDWLLWQYGSWYKKVLKGLDIAGWDKLFDCDDFARLYADLCQACHAAGNSRSEGIAVGKLAYIEAPGRPHAINFAVTDVGVIFVEPQWAKEVKLTDEQVRSIYWATLW